jgi:hypothetical protein
LRLVLSKKLRRFIPQHIGKNFIHLKVDQFVCRKNWPSQILNFQPLLIRFQKLISNERSLLRSSVQFVQKAAWPTGGHALNQRVLRVKRLARPLR